MAGEVLVFNARGKANTAARLHAANCPVVAGKETKGHINIIREDIEDHLADLADREWHVARCKCLPKIKPTETVI